MVTAAEIGADLFLVPADNCAEALRVDDPGFPLARVATLDDALEALADLQAGRDPRDLLTAGGGNPDRCGALCWDSRESRAVSRWPRSRPNVQHEGDRSWPCGPPCPCRPCRGARSCVLGAVGVLLVLFTAIGTLTNVYVDYLWFDETGFTEVFWTELQTRALLFAVAGVATGGLVAAAIYLAYRFRPTFRPMSLEQQNLERYRQSLEPRRGLVLDRGRRRPRPVRRVHRAGQLADLAGVPQQHRLRPGRPGVRHRPVVLRLRLPVLAAGPGLRLRDRAAGADRLAAHPLRVRRAAAADAGAEAHVGRAGAAVGAARASSWRSSRWRTGSTATAWSTPTAARSSPAPATPTSTRCCVPKTILVFVAALCALAFFANIFVRNFLLPAGALVLLLVTSLVIGVAYPAIVQQFVVKPSANEKEAPYIDRAIASTRDAYGLSTTTSSTSTTRSSATGDEVDTEEALAELRNDTETIPNARLLDPNVLSGTFTARQQIRNVYGFPEKLDIDRYTIDGETRDYVVAVRELNSDGPVGEPDQLDQPAHRLHARQRLRRGARERGRRRPGRGRRAELHHPRPAHDRQHRRRAEPRIYYGELIQDGGQDVYSVVGAPDGATPREFDQPEGGSEDERPDQQHLRRRGRRLGRQLLPAADLRHLLPGAQLPALRRGQRRLEGALRPRPARPGGEGRAVPRGRRRPVPGGHRRPGRLDPRRLHDARTHYPYSEQMRARRGGAGLADRHGDDGAARRDRSTTSATR